MPVYLLDLMVVHQYRHVLRVRGTSHVLRHRPINVMIRRKRKGKTEEKMVTSDVVRLFITSPPLQG